jgi:hypothetical protein
MGRPLNHKFFGDLNYSFGGMVGGEGIASVTAPAGTLGTLVNGTYTIPAGSIGAPDISGGVKAVLAVVVTGAAAYTVTVVSSGSGYTSAPTITFAGSIAGGTGTASPVATLTSGATARRNAIAPQVRIGGTNRTSGNDIVSQKGSKRFVCISQDGTGVCKLVAATPANPLEMAIAATDSQSNTYWVRKITKNKVELIQNTLVGATWDIADGDNAKWTITGSAVAPTAGGNPSATDGPTVVDIGTVVLANA